ncbi:flagellar hook-associated protein FlgK [Clostridium algidicarnis]|uniref:flagellar hook-associated protein FlgK n=1 Tax=Clostridium algidicarnis TaxID=37659 RepID=UPI001629156C|nr:flagellar hook-associated protein FlgK [Clostridium algidicarnis]MBB6630433.1 flagellar hook-associated protein FlgK [Clostridium algidicarnis]MCB2286561.1 flagellar hook-associated protein FlgK [Clostridium algidicarnis]
MSGLFGTFNIAKRGMFTQQKALDVTAHNIANVNTDGYSRQRAKISTTRPFATPSIHNTAEPGQLGTGSQIAAIERIRDSFIDFQVRAETSILGQYSTREKFLSEVEGILNEPTDTGISNLMGEFYKAWQDLSKHPEGSNTRVVAAEKSASLANSINHTFGQLEKLKENSKELTRSAVAEVSALLDQIDKLNQEIMTVNVSGKMPNDLMDQRDMLLDEISSKFNIKIEKSNYEGINLKAEDSNLNMIKAVNNKTEVNRLSYVDSIDAKKDPLGQYTGDIEVTYYKLGNKLSAENKVTVKLKMDPKDQNEISRVKKELEDSRVIWTNANGEPVDDNGVSLGAIDGVTGELTLNAGKSFNTSLFKPSKGELKGLMSINDDIQKYENDLNRLAKSLAWSVNAIHTKNIDKNDQILFFVNKDGGSEDDINASNIAVNPEIMKDVMKILVGSSKESGESDNERALAIAGLKDTILMIQDIGSDIKTREDLIGVKGSNGFDTAPNEFFIKNNVKGMKMDAYFKNMVNKLGVDAQEAKQTAKNQRKLLASFEESRLSISGVSEDEEMTNLIQFQHAYQANAKVIATIDELLDVVINGLKR